MHWNTLSWNLQGQATERERVREIICLQQINRPPMGKRMSKASYNYSSKKASKVVTRSVQSSFRLCTCIVVVITLIKSRETVWCFLDGGSPLHCVSRGRKISCIVI